MRRMGDLSRLSVEQPIDLEQLRQPTGTDGDTDIAPLR